MMDILEGLVRSQPDVVEPRRRAVELELCREHVIQIGRLASIGKAYLNLTQRLPQFLTAIGMSVENALAKMDFGASSNGAGQELEAALQAVSALATGVAQVCAFAETGPKRPLVHPVDLGVSLARVLPLLEPQRRRASAIIHIENHAEWPMVCMAEGDAEQLFFALIDNLLRIAESQREHRITISSVVNEANADIVFSGGNRLATREDVDVPSGFVPPAEPGIQSSDLGLHVAYDVAVRAGGTIRREGTAGSRPVFFVSLPIVERVSCMWGQDGRRPKATDLSCG